METILPIIIGAFPMSLCLGIWEGIAKYTRIKWYWKVLSLPLFIVVAFSISFLCLWIWKGEQ